MLKNIEKIYVCHYKKLTDRKNIIIKQFKNHNIDDYEFVELFDKDSWDIEYINEHFPEINKTNLSDGEKSLALKHAWILEDAFNKNYKSVIIFEDDVLLCENFIDKFNSYMIQLPRNWDIGWIGTCCNLSIPYDGINNVYKTDIGSRCTHAFCVNKNFISKYYKEFKNINQPSDFYYNYIIKQFNCNNYWFEPALAVQNKNFSSSLK